MLLSPKEPNGFVGLSLDQVRDTDRSIDEAVAGASWLLTHLHDATTAEAIALQRGLELLEDLGCQLVIVESDSLEIIQACNGVIEIWSPYSAILTDCFQKALCIGVVSFMHCPRYANRLTRNLARHSFDSNSIFVWDGDHPVCYYLTLWMM